MKISKLIYLFTALVTLFGLSGYAEDSGRPYGEDPSTWTPRDLLSEGAAQDSSGSN